MAQQKVRRRGGRRYGSEAGDDAPQRLPRRPRSPNRRTAHVLAEIDALLRNC